MEFIGESYKILLFLFAIIGFLESRVPNPEKFYGHGLDDAFDRLSIYFGSSNRSFEEQVIASHNANCMQQLSVIYISMALLFCLAVTAAVTYGIFELGVTGKQFYPL
jgi:hypothetical protein